MIKTQQSRYGENVLQYNKDIYDKPTANVMLNDEKLKAFPLKSRARQGCPILTLPFNIVLKVLATIIKQEIQGICIESKDVNLWVFAND